MKFDKSGILIVGAAAAVLYMVVKQSTAVKAGAPATTGQGAIGANASGFWGNVINNLSGGVSSGSQMPTGGQYLPGYFGMSLFDNGTFSDGVTYTDPGQVSYNSNTGKVTESPLSGMYNLLAPGTYGF
ncbi:MULTISPECIES: hypothetical protein [unclassified Caballeronia]|uniref:hypothetical protein n=1 Tax=unclassified Caballeronia TaxID=2646786 RepID=UPI0020289FEF|nr:MULTISPECIES: hypothetical protein [unclassified Caballeronia]